MASHSSGPRLLTVIPEEYKVYIDDAKAPMDFWLNMGISIFLLQWLNLRVNPDPTPQMKMLTYFMPVMLTVMFLYFASGLNLYYAASNIASLPQQLQIMNERKKLRRKLA